MIKYHPTSEVLQQFVCGELPASVSVIVASHVEMCSECHQRVQQFTLQQANTVFELVDDQFKPTLDDSQTLMPLTDDALAMIDTITDEPAQEFSTKVQRVNEIEVAGKRINLPQAMKSIGLKEWQGLGKLSRSRLALDDGDLRASLLHIDKGGSVPTHTHKGFEITLLLQGSFADEMGVYHAGDFIWLDGKHTHQPTTSEGCVCLTVSSDAIHFTQGVSQLLNPIGRFIY
ncbi:ChrR family anti-sigma-E factor [Shewanella sp. Isolate11]|uniref:ChrR family anti-sigma-E factor n=1 Tax=Shewanella sp. Isolate11 TaxID=2908530 RepID=UPI001EFDB57D|nr:ChrR family anti-sigma-E factor [Shewanella sp. Isolate11]MCG9697086.1 ChrR family anti-sigma-E factor [Shewanella sp. Isolate11]